MVGRLRPVPGGVGTVGIIVTPSPPRRPGRFANIAAGPGRGPPAARPTAAAGTAVRPGSRRAPARRPAAFHGPDAVRVLAASGEHRLVAVAVGALLRAGQYPLEPLRYG